MKTITGFIECPKTGKRFELATIGFRKFDSQNPNIKFGISQFRKYLISVKKEMSGYFRREYGFISHNLKLTIHIK